MRQTPDNPSLPLTRIQKLIGRYMLQSKQTKASAYLRVRADLSELVTFRKAYCRNTKSRVTTNDFFICAIARSLMQFPLMAATLDVKMENLTIPEDIGIGFAVAAPQGLVVPVIKAAQKQTLPELATASSDLLNKARANKLAPDDFDGATMVLTGLGMYGIDSFYAISPLSATGIISIGNFEEVALPAHDGFIARKMMYVAMAFDQRVADAFYAANFLKAMVQMLENPKDLVGD